MKARLHWWAASFYCWVAARAASVASFASARTEAHAIKTRHALGIPDKVEQVPCCPGFMDGRAHNEWCHKMQ